MRLEDEQEGRKVENSKREKTDTCLARALLANTFAEESAAEAGWRIHGHVADL